MKENKIIRIWGGGSYHKCMEIEDKILYAIMGQTRRYSVGYRSYVRWAYNKTFIIIYAPIL